MKVSSISIYMFGKIGHKIGTKNDHISGYRPFPKMIIGHNAIKYVTKGPIHPKGIKNNAINKF